MKRTIKSGVVLIFLLLLIVSGCKFFPVGLVPYYRDPKSITIDGEEYVSGFYDNLHVVGLEYKESATCLFSTDTHYWWHLEDSMFDMYYCLHKESLYWNPALYCKKDQLEKLRNYYLDTDNFDCYIGLYLEDKEHIQVSDGTDREMAEQALAVIWDIEYSSPIAAKQKYQSKSLYLEEGNYRRPTIYRKSKDGLFSTTHLAWMYYEENIYVIDTFDGHDSTYDVYVIDSNLNSYIVSMLKRYGFVD